MLRVVVGGLRFGGPALVGLRDRVDLNLCVGGSLSSFGVPVGC